MADSHAPIMGPTTDVVGALTMPADQILNPLSQESLKHYGEEILLVVAALVIGLVFRRCRMSDK